MADGRFYRTSLSGNPLVFDKHVAAVCYYLTDGCCCLVEGRRRSGRTLLCAKVAKKMHKEGEVVAVMLIRLPRMRSSFIQAHSIPDDIKVLRAWDPVPDEVTLLILDNADWFPTDFDFEAVLTDSRRRWMMTTEMGGMTEAEDLVPSTIKSSAKR